MSQQNSCKMLIGVRSTIYMPIQHNWSVGQSAAFHSQHCESPENLVSITDKDDPQGGATMVI